MPNFALGKLAEHFFVSDRTSDYLDADVVLEETDN